jgi:DNA polymerase elongation subunit (family B)
MAEDFGFEVIHGIVDSLWLKKPGVSPAEVAEFCREASEAVGVPLSVEGKYRWIVFLPSKVLGGIPVLNRYYGVFENGKIKMRGIEARRQDASPLIRQAQIEMIERLAKASSFDDFEAKIPEALSALKEFAERLVRNRVSVQELLIARRLAKHPSEYRHEVFQAIAAKQLLKAGFDVHPGQTVKYIIVDAHGKRMEKRALAAQLITPQVKYNTQKYLELLTSAGDTLLGVFDYNSDRIRDEILYRQRQLVLN